MSFILQNLFVKLIQAGHAFQAGESFHIKTSVDIIALFFSKVQNIQILVISNLW